MKIVEKYSKLVKILTTGLVGKEEVIKLGLLTLLAKENMLLVGPPGTAKSEVARRLSKVIKGGLCFEYLLTKFTTPEELFGPISLSELKNDIFKRKTDGYLPTAHVGFLDEIFKANSSILNALLTIINEKVYHNGKDIENANIITIIGASNELPTEEEELSALYDRFLMRKVVGYLSDSEISKLYDINKTKIEVPAELKFSVEEINKLNNDVENVKISTEARTILGNIRKEIRTTFNGEENISDRKFVKLLHFLKLSAFLNGRDSVDYNDFAIINDCLWNKQENISKIRNIVKRNANV